MSAPVALITGAGKRLGYSIAKTLVDSGFDLFLHVNQSREGAEKLADYAKTLGRRTWIHSEDLCKPHGPAGVARAFQATGKNLDLLVHNAGLYSSKTIEELEAESLDRMWAIHARAPALLTKELYTQLQNASTPCIVAITDADVAKPYSHYSHYFMSKAALEMWVRVAALELAPKVRVNGIAPGTVMLPEGLEPVEIDSIKRSIPSRKFGSPEDVAKAVLFLTKDGQYCNGQILRIDGGRSAT